jgi:hypothetical protein
MASGMGSARSAWKDGAMDKRNETLETDELTSGLDQDPELWDWARTAGVSREELLAAVRHAVRQTASGVN